MFNSTKHVSERCAKAKSCLVPSGEAVEKLPTQRLAICCISVFPPVLSYSSQVWSHQTIGLIKHTKEIHLDLILLSYWHEYMDLLFFFEAINGLVDVSENVLPKLIIPSGVARSSSTTQLLFRPQKCRTTTFQKSYIARVTRVWNCLPPHLRQPNILLSTCKGLLRDCYLEAMYNI